MVAKRATLREARLAGRIDHDNVVAIYHVAEERGVPFLVMPLLQGELLESWLGRRERERPEAADPFQVIGSVLGRRHEEEGEDHAAAAAADHQRTEHQKDNALCRSQAAPQSAPPAAET